jgi:hypothetical protein
VRNRLGSRLLDLLRDDAARNPRSMQGVASVGGEKLGVSASASSTAPTGPCASSSPATASQASGERWRARPVLVLS